MSLFGWSWWPDFAVRAPGLPAARVLGLAVPETSRALDSHQEKVRRSDTARRAAVELCLERERAAQAAQVPAIRKLIKQLKKDRSIEGGSIGELDLEVQAALRTHARAVEERDAARASACAAFERETISARVALRAAAHDPVFREALAWQNRAALTTGVEKLTAQRLDAQDSKTRQHERLVVRYLQRYCTKNETIGFFGPVGFGIIGGEAPLEASAGPALLAERRVHFEYWAVDLLAQRMSEDPRLRPFLCPRRRPDLWLEGDRLRYPIQRMTSVQEEASLDPSLARAFEQCTGDRPAHVIDDEEALEELEAGGLIFWTIELPTAGVPPERALREILETLEPASLRAELIRPLAELERAKDEVARAAGDPGAVKSAMAALESTFTALTSVERPDRRTIVYEDCRRDVTVSLSAETAARVLRPLSLLLASARWFSHRIAERYRQAFDELYRGPTDFIEFWPDARALFTESPATPAVVLELQQRWAEILGLSSDARAVVKTTEELERAVQDRFAAPHPGWPAARHHSPDLLLTPSLQFVLGELHLGMNTLTNPFMMELHPQRETLRERREHDLPVPCIAPVWSKARTRADFFSPSRHDLDLENGVTKSWRPREQVVRSGELVVERRDDRLVVRTRDRSRGSRDFDIIRFVEQHLIAEAHGRFDPLPPLDHRPRVTVDELVIARESWRVKRDGLDFIEEPDAFERFAKVRSWAGALGLPRFLFYKVLEQPKPVYLDLESPMLVELFISQIRSTDLFVVAEMLPDPTQLWLTDRQGGSYTAELRMVALDPEPFPH